jgi:hypothetical protein
MRALVYDVPGDFAQQPQLPRPRVLGTCASNVEYSVWWASACHRIQAFPHLSDFARMSLSSCSLMIATPRCACRTLALAALDIRQHVLSGVVYVLVK